MLVVISPAKKLDWTDVPGMAQTIPDFSNDAVYLAGVAAKLSEAELRKLMDISSSLAALNRDRFQDFVADPSPDATRPAVRAFAGDTYQGLHARSLDAATLAYGQDQLRILSGLYGVLRPCDGIQPYRLEMGSKLKTDRGANLYAYWGTRLAEALNAQAAATGARALVNCASQEYFGAVDRAALAVPVVTPTFLEDRADGPKVISFHAKRARGAMARFMLDERVADPADLAGFDALGYVFDPARSTPEAPVFRRSEGAQQAA
ncbi:peroxide stress protein YaaA [Meridianimarinicoccus sp. RP-17]|uniref:peroxide stress protein YaaA n=1 Tax=Meridianimarinicoccus zhengii TaxID=2056810 RepID=UPI000DAE8277|nr:peroxide stress protein YaaA [Phycocomes zhengii]